MCDSYKQLASKYESYSKIASQIDYYSEMIETLERLARDREYKLDNDAAKLHYKQAEYYKKLREDLVKKLPRT